MYVDITVKPPNRVYYLSRCRRLRKDLERAHKLPGIIIVAGCYRVLKEAFGSDLKVLRWIFLCVVYDRWEDLKQTAWFNWHMYVRLRTRKEISDLRFKGADEATGIEARRLLEMEDEAEFREYLDRKGMKSMAETKIQPPKEERWIVRYRRYSSDKWIEEPFRSQAEARKFRDDYLYDRGPEAQAVIKHFVEER